VMLLSEAVSNALTGGDESLIGGLIIAATLMALNFSLAFITARSSRMAGIVDGNAILLGRDGKIFHKVREREHVAEADIEKALREQDCELVEMSCLFLESDGSISVMKTKR
jgi:uncharacterized membrane protein YcaP (DUF421 family)